MKVTGSAESRFHKKWFSPDLQRHSEVMTSSIDLWMTRRGRYKCPSGKDFLSWVGYAHIRQFLVLDVIKNNFFNYSTVIVIKYQWRILFISKMPICHLLRDSLKEVVHKFKKHSMLGQSTRCVIGVRHLFSQHEQVYEIAEHNLGSPRLNEPRNLFQLYFAWWKTINFPPHLN